MTAIWRARHLSRLLQFGALIGLFALLWVAADGQGAFDLLLSADWRWLFAAVALLTLQTVLSSLRWRLTAARLGLSFPFGEALREYYLSQVVNQSLPGGVLGDASRAVRARHRAGLYVSAQAVVFERLAGQIGLLVVMFTGLAIGGLIPSGIVWPVWVVHFGMALTSLILLGVVLCRLCVPVLQNKAKQVIADFRQAIVAKEVIAQQTVLSLSTALCNVFAFAACARALDVALPLIVVVTLVPVILFAMVVPLSVSGWGVREGAAALMFPIFGATASEGLATSVAFGLAFLFTVGPGYIAVWSGSLFRQNDTRTRGVPDHH